MSLREVWHARRQRADEVLDAFGWSAVGRRRSLQERLERHADNVGRSTAEAAGCSPERTTQRGGQSHGDLILHKTPPIAHCNCSAAQCSRQGPGRWVQVPWRRVYRTRPSTCARKGHIGVGERCPKMCTDGEHMAQAATWTRAGVPGRQTPRPCRRTVSPATIQLGSRRTPGLRRRPAM